MKKLFVIILIFISFFIGISLGEMTSSKSAILEEEIKTFEEEIQKENNYKNLEFKPKSNIFNKIANLLESTINAIFEKIEEKL